MDNLVQVMNTCRTIKTFVLNLSCDEDDRPTADDLDDKWNIVSEDNKWIYKRVNNSIPWRNGGKEVMPINEATNDSGVNRADQ